MFKRAFDIGFSIMGLAVLSFVMGVIAVSIKLTSPGPVLHRGLRSGRHGLPFRICKFRTMVVSSEGPGSLTTAKNDPRVTKIGAVLRRYKLDEFPQLFNVLRGEMSVVGPRPEMPELTNLYNEEEQFILSVRPGITDNASLELHNLADVVGSRNVDEIYIREVFARKNELRMIYVRERTFLNDLMIIFRTGLVVFKR